MTTTAYAPGRVNLIGDHTDYSGGLVLPIAIDLGTTVSGEPGGDDVRLRSESQPLPAVVPLDVSEPTRLQPEWAHYVGGVVARLRPAHGFRGTVRSTLPSGGGLSSSAALEVALALALGADLEPLALARLCMEAEHLAGTRCGIMDQLASAAGVEGHALLIDCAALTIEPVPIPDGLQVVIVDSGVAHRNNEGEYTLRRTQCEQAAALIGPLHLARPGDEAVLADPLLRQRARHVVTENERVRAFVAALRSRDVAAVGPIMAASHASLRGDFGVSVDAVDDLVDRLAAAPGVHGARMTGGGFGGYVVALCDPGALDGHGRVVSASAGARRLP